MRALYVSPLGRGGVDFGIQNITRAVRRAGMQAELLRLPEIYNFAPFLIPRALPAGWWQNFDLIQGRSRVAFALRAPGKPLVTTVHHLTTDPLLLRYSSFQQRMFYRLIESRYDRRSIQQADAVVCVSRFTERQVHTTYGRTDTVVVYDGIDTDRFVPPPGGVRRDELPPSPARIRLLFVGNRTRRKGFDLLPRIMQRLPDDYVLYYTGGFQGRETTPLHPRMIPIGSPDLAGLITAYQSCDILLFPSRLEGFGIVAAEALLCGRPVVTTNSSALPEVVQHEQSGLLCELDNVDAYAAAVRRLGEDARMRQEYGEYGRAFVTARYGYAALAEGLIAVYRKLTNTPSLAA